MNSLGYFDDCGKILYIMSITFIKEIVIIIVIFTDALYKALSHRRAYQSVNLFPVDYGGELCLNELQAA